MSTEIDNFKSIANIMARNSHDSVKLDSAINASIITMVRNSVIDAYQDIKDKTVTASSPIFSYLQARETPVNSDKDSKFYLGPMFYNMLVEINTAYDNVYSVEERTSGKTKNKYNNRLSAVKMALKRIIASEYGIKEGRVGLKFYNGDDLGMVSFTIKPDADQSEKDLQVAFNEFKKTGDSNTFAALQRAMSVYQSYKNSKA